MKHVIIKNHIAKRRLLTATPVEIKKVVDQRPPSIQGLTKTFPTYEKGSSETLKKTYSLSNMMKGKLLTNSISLDKLDYIGAVCFTGNRERHKLLLDEFCRCKLPAPEVIWTFPSPYRNFVLSRINHLDTLDKHPGYWGAGIAHYRHLKIAYELGCSNALIVEDDCRFLQDINRLEETMKNVPVDWDVLMLDNFRPTGLRSVSKGWSICDAALSSACYIVNRKAMSRLIALYESPITTGQVMRHCDHWTDVRYIGRDVKIYCSTPNLAIQCYVPGTTNGGGEYMQKLYLKSGLSFSDYAPYGKPINVFYCVNGSSRAREWLSYSINSIKRLYKKAGGVNIFVASEEPYIADGITWIDAKRYIKKYGMDKISQISKFGRVASPMQIFRLAAPVLPEFDNIDTLLYLDIDTEVVSPGITSLFYTDFDSDVLAIHEHSRHGNKSTEIMLSDPELRSIMSEHTIKRLTNGGYFNNGVMVMNLKRMRQEHPDWSERLPFYVEMAVKHHRIVVDQDISNVILDALPLSPEFNVMPDTDVKMPDINPVIIHYANNKKYSSTEYPPIGLRSKCFNS